jgi:hypothetical protein
MMMRIGDVGAVSQVGDLLAFSLAVVLVLTLIYQVEVRAREDDDPEGTDWLQTAMAIRTWEVLDPDGDGVVDLDGITERIANAETPFPVENEVRINFILVNGSLELGFSNGEAIAEGITHEGDVIVHGFSVLVRTEGSVLPCLMNIMIFGGTE